MLVVVELGDDLVAVPIARWIALRRGDGGPVDPRVEQRLQSLTVEETGLPLFTTEFHADDEIVIKVNIHRGDYPDTDDIGGLDDEFQGIRALRAAGRPRWEGARRLLVSAGGARRPHGRTGPDGRPPARAAAR